jgi:hypothetical protein
MATKDSIIPSQPTCQREGALVGGRRRLAFARIAQDEKTPLLVGHAHVATRVDQNIFCLRHKFAGIGPMRLVGVGWNKPGQSL